MTSRMQQLSSRSGPASMPCRRAVVPQTQPGLPALLMPRFTALTRLHRPALKSKQLLPLQASTMDAPPDAETVEAERPVATGPNEDEASTSGVDDIPLEKKLGISVRVQNLFKDYQVKDTVFKAVQDATLDFPANQIIALLGPSGSGKTTLLRLIAGLESVTSGQIFFGEVDATHIPVQQRGIGMVFQSYALFRHMTVAENITFGPRIQDLDIDEEERVEALLKMVEMPGYADHKPPQLSGGQRQRVALARALACNPQLLLLDEPFGALDPEVRKSLRDSVKDIIHRVGVTSILVTHDQEEAFDIADKVVIFNRGRIEQVGTAREILDNPATPFVMNFVSDVNQIPSTCQFVKRMGVITDKTHVMVQPTMIVMRQQPESKRTSPATIVDIINVGWLVKYFLIFDDDVKIEIHVRREDEAKYYNNLDVRQRVHVQVDAAEMMPFNKDEIDSSPLG
ncbi:hypothetical protein ABBQ38_014032 [Trebouxia sp. C0009 RCD-2024]